MKEGAGGPEERGAGKIDSREEFNEGPCSAPGNQAGGSLLASSTPAVTIIAGADHPEDARRQCEVKARDWASGAEESAQVQRGGIALSHSLG